MPKIPKLVLVPTCMKIKTAIMQMVSGTLTGDDAKPAEVYKYSGFVMIWKLVPREFTDASITHLFN